MHTWVVLSRLDFPLTYRSVSFRRGIVRIGSFARPPAAPYRSPTGALTGLVPATDSHGDVTVPKSGDALAVDTKVNLFLVEEKQRKTLRIIKKEKNWEDGSHRTVNMFIEMISVKSFEKDNKTFNICFSLREKSANAEIGHIDFDVLIA